ncbi:uncharacterized protein LOC143817570 [Ranitomeya variabilis]|uniref:uncharacterized protein LOC143817570 n=1 Tax=Ranitomeya variabilis TaxID=490064 RepID=UPI0040560B97
MKDRFNKDLRQESQLPSGSAARIRKYKYHRILAFLRPVLARRTTWSSTVGPGSGAVLHQSATDPSQPSSSTAASGPATQPGDQEAGPSGVPLPQSSASSQFFMGSSRQWQRAADRSLMPEFLHLSSVFHEGLKAMGDQLDTAISHMSTRIQEVTTALAQVKDDLQRPAHHFFNQIEQGMSEHLSPELQITVMQACNAAYVQAMQQSRYFQQTVGAFPTVPTLSRFTSMPTFAAYHCTATSIPNTAGPYYSTTTMPSAVGQPTATTMTTAAPAWASSTATSMLPPQDPALAFPGTTTRLPLPDPALAFPATTTRLPLPDPALAFPGTTTRLPLPDPALAFPATTTRLPLPDPALAFPGTTTRLPLPDPALAFPATTTRLPLPDPALAFPGTTTRLPLPDPALAFPATTTTSPRKTRKGKGKKKQKTIAIPPPSPPNVSVMSGLSHPSSVSQPSHVSSPIPEYPDPSSFIAPSPATPMSATVSQTSQLNTPQYRHSTPSRRS